MCLLIVSFPHLLRWRTESNIDFSHPVPADVLLCFRVCFRVHQEFCCPPSTPRWRRPVSSVNCSYSVFMCLSLAWPFADCELNVCECFKFPTSEGYNWPTRPPPPFTRSAFGMWNNRLRGLPQPPPPSVWTTLRPLGGRQRDAIKMKRKTISSAGVPVRGNEIARPIVACNGERSEVNWGEIGH